MLTASLLILVQPSSSGRASPSVCLEMQYRLPPGSHLAAAVHLPLSVQRQYRLPNGSHPAAFAPLPPVVQQQSCPTAVALRRTYSRAAIQQWPCLSLCLCRCSTGYLLAAIQREATGTTPLSLHRQRERVATAAGWLAGR